MRRRLPIPVVALLLAPLVTAPAVAQIDTVEVAVSGLGNPAIAAVPQGDIAPLFGRTHIAYTRNGTIRHAWKDSGPWFLEDVNQDQAENLDIAVDGSGLATIAYGTPDGRLMCARRTPGGWDTDTVATVPGATMLPSVALGAGPAIAYLQCASGACQLRYAWREGGHWLWMQLDSSTGSSFAPSLVMDPQGNPHIAYGARAATSNGSTLEELDGAFLSGPFSIAVVDTEGTGPFAIAWDAARQTPRIAYGAAHLYSDSTSRVFIQTYRYAFIDRAFNWHNQFIDYISDASSTLSLTLDPLGTPWVAHILNSILAPGLESSVEGCSYTSSHEVTVLSQQPAFANSNFFRLPRFWVDVPYIYSKFGSRSIVPAPVGYAVSWREAGDACPPATIMYAEWSSGATNVSAGAVARARVELSLGPNPRRRGQPVELRWSQVRNGRVEFMLHDVSGRVLARERAGWFPAGAHVRAWQPGALPAGLYWVSLIGESGRLATRALVNR